MAVIPWSTDLLDRLTHPALSAIATHNLPVYLAILELTLEIPAVALTTAYLEERAKKRSGQVSATLSSLETSGHIFRAALSPTLKVYAVLVRPDGGPVVESQEQFNTIVRWFRGKHNCDRVGPLPVFPEPRLHLTDPEPESEGNRF